MAHAAPLDPANLLTPPPPDPLEAVIALCRRARPEPGGEAARELSRLLAGAARAGGPGASERIAQALAGAEWWTKPTETSADVDFDVDEPPDRPRDERRLADKLAACGRLGPGLLLRALAQGRPALFHAGLAVLSGSDRAALEAAIGRSPLALALALRAARVDRAAFPAAQGRLAGLQPAAAAAEREVAAALALAPAEASARLAEVLRA